MSITSGQYTIVSHIGECRAALSTQLARAAEIIRGTMESHAKRHITEAVYDAPETWYVRTGNLRNSITSRVAEDAGDTIVVVGTDVRYAAYVELGTGIYALGESNAKEIPWNYIGTDGRWHHTYGMHPRPYLRPAVENHIEEYKRILENELKDR